MQGEVLEVLWDSPAEVTGKRFSDSLPVGSTSGSSVPSAGLGWSLVWECRSGNSDMVLLPEAAGTTRGQPL